MRCHSLQTADRRDRRARTAGRRRRRPARYIEALIPFGRGTIRVCNLYLPNGNPIGTEKFTYKLAWMKRLKVHLASLLALEETVLVLGDFNIIPDPIDAKNPQAWTEDALFQPKAEPPIVRS